MASTHPLRLTFPPGAAQDAQPAVRTLAYLDPRADVIVDGASVGACLTLSGGERILGLPSIFVYLSRLAHTLPAEPLLCAKVHEWLELERAMMRHVDAAAGAWFASWRTRVFVLGTLRILDDGLVGAHWLGDFEASTAADFCWLPRLQWIERRYSIDWTAFPSLWRYMGQQPERDLCAVTEETAVLACDYDDERGSECGSGAECGGGECAGGDATTTCAEDNKKDQ